jgi:hypothetical protein
MKGKKNWPAIFDQIGAGPLPLLNDHLSNFARGQKRAESKWDLDSRNVRYGIF